MEDATWMDLNVMRPDDTERLPITDGRNADATPVSRVVACCHCSTAFHWPGQESERSICPHCAAELVILFECNEVCTVHPTTRDSIDEMICDWLEDRSVEDEDLEDDEYEEDAFGKPNSHLRVDAA